MSSVALPLRGLNHVSLVCSDVHVSYAFYHNVLGFAEVKRPSSFDFDGCWLVRSGIGLHLIQGTPIRRATKINPRSDHLSFQSDQIDLVIAELKSRGIDYIPETLVEGDITVHQVFFHDPDHNMIEICNCDCLPMEPLPLRSFVFFFLKQCLTWILVLLFSVSCLFNEGIIHQHLIECDFCKLYSSLLVKRDRR